MKFSTTLFGLTGLVGMALAGAPIKNADLSSDVVVPNKYIVTYKTGVSSTKRKKHQEDITKKAKSKSKKGVVDSIDLGSLQGYVVEIPKSELKDIVDSPLVSRPTSLHLASC